MSMTDPIADILARIRNGIRARKPQVEMPPSKIKLRLAELLKSEGFISTFTVARGPDSGRLICSSSATTARPQRHHRHAPRVAPGQRTYVPPPSHPARPLRPRHRHPLHVEGRDDRPRGAQEGRSAASSSARCGEPCPASDVSQSPIPKGVTGRRISDGIVVVKGPKGELDAPSPAGISVKTRRRTSCSSRTDDSRPSARKHGLIRALVNNMVKRRDRRASSASSRSTASVTRPRSRARTSTCRSATRTRSTSSSRGRRGQGRQEPRHPRRASTARCVGAAAAKIRSFRRPEPYKGKGVKYVEEVIRRRSARPARS